MIWLRLKLGLSLFRIRELGNALRVCACKALTVLCVCVSVCNFLV